MISANVEHVSCLTPEGELGQSDVILPADLQSTTMAPAQTGQALHPASAAGTKEERALSPKKVCLLSSVRKATEHRILWKEGQSLRGAGYEVTIVASHPRDEVISGINIRALPEFKSRISRMMRKTCRIYREAMRQRADVYHLQDPELIPAGLLLKARGKRVLYDVREDVPADLLDKHYLPRWIRPAIAWAADVAETIAGRAFDGIVAVTPHIRDRFSRQNSVLVQNFPVLDEALPPSLPYAQRAPLVIYVGSISPVRGIPELVGAMGLLPKNMEARLAIGGEFVPASMEQQVSAIPGWERTQYLGWQEREGLLDLLSRARVGAIPLLHTANHAESQPIKLFEYMLSGLPVVAFYLPRTTEIIEESGCGIVVEARNTRKLAEAIQWLLEHPAEAEAMGKRGREAVLKSYNWNTQAASLLELYRRITT